MYTTNGDNKYLHKNIFKIDFKPTLIVELGAELYDFVKVNRLVKVVSRKLNYRSLSKVCFKHKARILLKGR